VTDAEIIREMLKNAEYFDSEEGADKYVEANAALDRLVAEFDRLRDWHGKTVPIVAALAIYGDRAILSSLAEKARALTEAKP
jgi:hypothetical protein